MINKRVYRKLSTCAAGGTRLETLQMLRDRIAKYLENEEMSTRDYAAMIVQFRQTMKEIDEIENGTEDLSSNPTQVSILDELSARRSGKKKAS